MMGQNVKSAARKLIRDPLAFCLDSKFSFLNKYGDDALKQQCENLLSLGAEMRETPVTIIMTVYNTGRHVESALRSILEQSHQRLEVMVIDDASTDNSLEILKEIAIRDDRVRLFHSSVNHGTYWSKNWCLNRAKNAYVAFHDSDDISHPDRIRVQLGAFRKWPDMKACSVRWQRVIEGRSDRVLMEGKSSRMALISLMIKRAPVLDKAGFFDCVRIAADSEYVARLGRIFGRKAVRNLRHILYTGLLREGSLTTGNAGGTLWNLNDSAENSGGPVDFERTLRGERALYHTAFQDWHNEVAQKTADKIAAKAAVNSSEDKGKDTRDFLKLGFPQSERAFDVPVSLTGGCNDPNLDIVKEIT
jgi:hypothetical protein